MVGTERSAESWRRVANGIIDQVVGGARAFGWTEAWYRAEPSDASLDLVLVLRQVEWPDRLWVLAQRFRAPSWHSPISDEELSAELFDDVYDGPEPSFRRGAVLFGGELAGPVFASWDDRLPIHEQCGGLTRAL